MPTSPPSVPGSVQISYDAGARRRTALFHGAIGDADLVNAYAPLASSADYDPEADDLVDLSAVTRFDVSAEGLRKVMDLFAPIDQLGIATRLAIVAPADAVYGVARMYQMLRGDDVPEEISVFRDRAAADAWLKSKRG